MARLWIQIESLHGLINFSLGYPTGYIHDQAQAHTSGIAPSGRHFGTSRRVPGKLCILPSRDRWQSIHHTHLESVPVKCTRIPYTSMDVAIDPPSHNPAHKPTPKNCYVVHGVTVFRVWPRRLHHWGRRGFFGQPTYWKHDRRRQIRGSQAPYCLPTDLPGCTSRAH